VQRLAEGEDRKAPLAQFLVREHRSMPPAVEQDVLIDFVGQNADGSVAHQLRERVQVGPARHRAARILRTVDDEEARTAVHGSSHAFPVEAEGRGRQGDPDALAARQTHRRLVGIVGRVENHGFVARSDHRLDRIVQSFGRPAGNGDLRLRIHTDGIARLDLAGDLLAQSDDPLHRRILIVPSSDCLDERLRQARIDGIVGKALADVDGALFEGAARHHGKDRRPHIR